MILPKLVITDIDGVWTDGGMYYDDNGNEWKKFNTSDSAGVLFLRLAGIPMAIMTGENSNAVRNRAKKLDIKHCYIAVKNKLAHARQLCLELNITLDQVAFIGDDINDLLLLREVGLSAAPSNAPEYIRQTVDLTMKKKGGEGAFREFVEMILSANQKFEAVLERYLHSKR